MTSLAETARPPAEGPARQGIASGQDTLQGKDILQGKDTLHGKAVLRGEARPDLIRDEVLGEIFCASAAARPDHPALVDGAHPNADGTHPALTYAEVEARAGAIARGLAHRGIGPGDVVGLWMARGPDLLVAQIGITLSGAAWLPFDAEAPADRVAVCLADAAAKALL
ncbi:MAG: AMP-binding protein, partial [Methylobacterium sp.]|uniref:AMP-binding protein n=1 Tax=Methylobacterium sp. TaxID=409 RepID=UPI00272863E3